jgi:hypothetical protein
VSTSPPGPPAFRLHLGLVAIFLFAIVTVATWPQVPNIATSVTDFGDPLLESRGVRYLLVHGPFYIRGNYAADVRALRARADLRWAGTFGWRRGGTSNVFILPAGGIRPAAH